VCLLACLPGAGGGLWFLLYFFIGQPPWKVTFPIILYIYRFDILFTY